MCREGEERREDRGPRAHSCPGSPPAQSRFLTASPTSQNGREDEVGTKRGRREGGGPPWGPPRGTHEFNPSIPKRAGRRPGGKVYPTGSVQKLFCRLQLQCSRFATQPRPPPLPHPRLLRASRRTPGSSPSCPCPGGPCREGAGEAAPA